MPDREYRSGIFDVILFCLFGNCCKNPVKQKRKDNRKGRSQTAFRYRASEDMIAAVSYIPDNAETLGVSSEEYMVLGSSAGGQLTVRYCAEKAYAQYGIPEPTGCIMLYPANWQKYDDEGCTTTMYITVCEDDPMIDVPGLDTAVEAMEAAGVPVSYNQFETGGHSFGMGVGTLAEGWLDRALLWMAEQ